MAFAPSPAPLPAPRFSPREMVVTDLGVGMVVDEPWHLCARSPGGRPAGYWYRVALDRGASIFHQTEMMPVGAMPPVIDFAPPPAAPEPEPRRRAGVAVFGAAAAVLVVVLAGLVGVEVLP